MVVGILVGLPHRVIWCMCVATNCSNGSRNFSRTASIKNEQTD